jgi:hypothetical protein
MSCVEVGAELGVSPSHACQLALSAQHLDVETARRWMAVDK